jgi:hypothetical protein
MNLADLNNNKELATRYVNAWTKIAKNVNNALIEYNARIRDDEAEKLRADLAECLEPWSVLEYISLDDAVKYLEGIANNEDDCYYCAKYVLDCAVRKFDEILEYVSDRKSIDIKRVNNYARRQFENFVQFEMAKTGWNFEDDK